MPFPLPLFVVLALPLLLLALPVLIPVLGILAARDRRRLCAVAEATPCAGCGRLLGLAAVEAADDAWTAAFADILRRHLIPRMVRRLFARCPSCGTDHGWDERTRTFHPLPATPRDGPEPPR